MSLNAVTTWGIKLRRPAGATANTHDSSDRTTLTGRNEPSGSSRRVIDDAAWKTIDETAPDINKFRLVVNPPTAAPLLTDLPVEHALKPRPPKSIGPYPPGYNLPQAMSPPPTRTRGRLERAVSARGSDGMRSAVRVRELTFHPVGPGSFDEILANTNDDPHNPQRARLITATHEAGHAVIGTLVGFENITAQLDYGGTTGANSFPTNTQPGGNLAAVLVAGFAAVGVLVGDDARQANQSGDQHDLPDSDFSRGLECAEAELGDGSDFDAQVEYLQCCETEVLKYLDDECVKNAVKHAASQLYYHGVLQPGLLNHICARQGL